MNDKFILLIEDSKAIRDALIWNLEYEGYNVLSAWHGQEALDLLEKNPLPALILLDVMMPIMDGWTFRERKNSDPRIHFIPTVILTAKINLDINLQLSSHESLIPNPFDISVLLEIVKNYCN